MEISGQSLKYIDIAQAKAAYLRGDNVTETLRKQLGSSTNTSAIIEIAYDLQAGSYIKDTLENLLTRQAYCEEISDLLAKHLVDGETLLDVGTGELTTLSLILSKLAAKPLQIYAFDISWSRLRKGLNFASEHMGVHKRVLKTFVADMAEIPLGQHSVDVTISSHALEPNGGREELLLKELFRVTRKKLLLFEPDYLGNSDEGRDRMKRLGYIGALEDVIVKLGAKLEAKIPVRNIATALNPTVCYVISPPAFNATQSETKGFTDPGSEFPLRSIAGLELSTRSGLAYPVIEGIPVLKSNAAILVTAMLDDIED